MSDRGRNTNLASEFHVLSMLYRLGLEASLTLGNKKSVDIVISHGIGKAATVEVKGIAGRDDWLINNLPEIALPHHFVVLVTYDGRMNDSAYPPRCWVFRHEEILSWTRVTRTGIRFIRRREIIADAKAYENRWSELAQYGL